MDLLIREFSFHQLNANLLWPGTFAFAEWLVQNHHCVEAGESLNWAEMKPYANLIKNLLFLLKSNKPTDSKTNLEETGKQHSSSGSGGNRGLPKPAFMMSW